MSNPRLSDLRALWEGLERSGGGGREYRATRVRSPAAISLYAGLREGDDARTLVFEGPLTAAPRPRTSFPGEGISLAEDRVASESVYRIAASLEGLAFSGPFEALCLDLIEVAESESDAGSAFLALVRRMAAWMASLRRRGGLTDEEVRGLYGELLCLRSVAGSLGWRAAVTAWLGPDDGIHDLSINGAAWEVKTSLGPGSAVWINGLDQLDEGGLTALFLVHHSLVQDGAGASLKSLTQEIRASISSSDPAASAEYERKLVAAGFLGTEPAADVLLRAASIAHYRVSGMFPRLLRSEVRQGVSEARYQIHVAALQSYGVDPDEALAALDPAGGAQ
jgi:hypothetical protein